MYSHKQSRSNLASLQDLEDTHNDYEESKGQTECYSLIDEEIRLQRAEDALLSKDDDEDLFPFGTESNQIEALAR
jgi:hypothetical protein